jgi:hypothetical protein
MEYVLAPAVAPAVAAPLGFVVAGADDAPLLEHALTTTATAARLTSTRARMDDRWITLAPPT